MAGSPTASGSGPKGSRNIIVVLIVATFVILALLLFVNAPREVRVAEREGGAVRAQTASASARAATAPAIEIPVMWTAFKQGKDVRVPPGYEVYYLEPFDSFTADCSFLGKPMDACDLSTRPDYDRIRVTSANAEEIHYRFGLKSEVPAPGPATVTRVSDIASAPADETEAADVPPPPPPPAKAEAPETKGIIPLEEYKRNAS
jgi:hypothetical protein